jgi:peptidyl-prolyl cis-trans isomerase SurA
VTQDPQSGVIVAEPILCRTRKALPIVRRWFAFTLFLLFASMTAHPAASQDLKIAAVVNEDVITVIDLLVRTRVAIVASHVQDTQENRQRLSGVVLRNLIDEHLKTQAAKSQGITVDEAEVNARLTELARQNQITLEEFKQKLAASGILIDSLADQFRADIAWQMVVRKRFRSAATVSRKDIDDEIAQMKENEGKPEYLVGEIFLPVYSPGDAAAVESTGNDLMAQLQQGANFTELAQQFSQSPTGSTGGVLGWLRADQLDPGMRGAVTAMTKGQITGPLQTSGGYSILTLFDQRTSGQTPIDEQAVTSRLTAQRLDTLARAYLSDLRTQAFIDIRQ